MGPGGVNAKGFKKASTLAKMRDKKYIAALILLQVAYRERFAEIGADPLEYDEDGYRIVLDGPSDMPSKYRKRVVFNEHTVR